MIRLEIAFLLFDGITALDVIGPYEVLNRLPGAEVRFVASKAGSLRADNPALGLVAGHALGDVPSPEIVLVPGGPGTRDLLEDEGLLEWLRAVHRSSRWTTSVCTGALVLGAAGILDGLRATTHWRAVDQLAGYGAKPTRERIVEEGKVITAAGVSAGIDMALRLAQRESGDLVAQALQLIIEYDPQPPFDAGSAARAPEEVIALATELLQSASGS